MMRTVLSIAIAATLAGCGRGDEASTPPPPTPKVATPSQAPSPPTDPGVVVAKDKTSAGGTVLAIGSPRMQVTQHRPYELAVSLATSRAFAVDRDEVKIWELDGGTLIARHELPWRVDTTVSMAVSPDGKWLAASRVLDGVVMHEPFSAVAFRIPISPFQFSSDSQGLVGYAGRLISALELARGKASLVKAPEPPQDSTDLVASQDGDQVYWIRDIDALRWDRTKNTLDVVARPSSEWKSAAIAARAPIAVVSEDRGVYRLDLTAGTVELITAERGAMHEISPQGDLVALGSVKGIRVLEARGGKQIASVQTTDVHELVFTDDENTIAYIDQQTIRIHDLAKGPRVYPEPSRFRGWLSADVAAIGRGAITEQLPVKHPVAAPLAAAALDARSPTPPPGAPVWATWITTMPDGTVLAADPSPLRDVPSWRRIDVGCPEKLRVWTQKGGERTFSLTSINREDPCWEISGGRVIAATMERIDIYDPVTGKRVARLYPGTPPEPISDPDLAHQYWMVAASPTGTHLALWWRRADVWAPPQELDPRAHGDLGHVHELKCEMDEASECKREYFAEVWSLEGKPKRVWRSRPDSKRWTGRTWPLPKIANGPIAFTHDGKHVLFGFDDGDIVIRSVDDAKPMRTETLHRAPIARIEVSPDDSYVFSEDSEGEQRIWPLARP
ncbi:MAG: WD40 repeat domain-containing protein [Kofleriaceae bacterium]